MTVPRLFLHPARLLTAVLVVALATATGCGRATRATSTSSSAPEQAQVNAKGTADAEADLGFPTLATKNTTRVAGADPVAVAAAAARIVFPSTSPGTHPDAVTLVDAGDWRAALLASVMNATPLHAPTLLTRGSRVPTATATALGALRPRGSRTINGAQVIRIGTLAKPGTLKTTDIRGGSAFELGRAVDAFVTAAQGKPSREVLLVTADDPAFAAPAAAWAATSGDPILFTHRDAVPPETIAALKAHRQPKIYVLGPSSVITPKVTRQLAKLGQIIRMGGPDPVSNAIEFAAFADGDFGWGASTPGHGLVLIPQSADPATTAAAAPLSASGTYGPTLLLSSSRRLDAVLDGYLKDIQPGFDKNAARGFYNHAWLIGDTKAISPTLQGQIDGSLETIPITREPPK